MARRVVWACAVAVLSVGLVGCGLFSEHGEWGEHHAVALSSLPSPVQATVARVTANGTVKRIDREREHGELTYCVEASVGGKDVNYSIDSSGKLLSTEPEASREGSGKEDRQECGEDHGAHRGEGHEKGHEQGEDND